LDDRTVSLASNDFIPTASLEDKTVREVLQLKINIKSTYRLRSMGYLLGSEEPLDWRVRMREPILVQLTKHHLAHIFGLHSNSLFG
jgi:Fe2+ transport system protein FeoA